MQIGVVLPDKQRLWLQPLQWQAKYVEEECVGLLFVVFDCVFVLFLLLGRGESRMGCVFEWMLSTFQNH
jgi:hypothetical protein